MNPASWLVVRAIAAEASALHDIVSHKATATDALASLDLFAEKLEAAQQDLRVQVIRETLAGKATKIIIEARFCDGSREEMVTSVSAEVFDRGTYIATIEDADSFDTDLAFAEAHERLGLGSMAYIKLYGLLVQYARSSLPVTRIRVDLDKATAA